MRTPSTPGSYRMGKQTVPWAAPAARAVGAIDFKRGSVEPGLEQKDKQPPPPNSPVKGLCKNRFRFRRCLMMLGKTLHRWGGGGIPLSVLNLCRESGPATPAALNAACLTLLGEGIAAGSSCTDPQGGGIPDPTPYTPHLHPIRP